MNINYKLINILKMSYSTDTPEMDHYNTLVVGYEIDYNQFIEIYADFLNIDKTTSYWKLEVNSYLKNGGIADFNKTLTNLPSRKLKFHFTNGLLVFGVELLEFDEERTSFDISFIQDINDYKKLIDEYLKDFVNFILMKSDNFKMHFMYYF
jgi:hypothetical protein